MVHDDLAWTEQVVRDLTAKHETGRSPGWSVDDAPARYTAGQLRAIVGVEVVITRVEAKWKLSQDRSPSDVDGVIGALGSGSGEGPFSDDDAALAAAMREVRDAGRS